MIIAIDPGKSGGIAIKNDYNEIHTWSMPKTDGDVIALFCDEIIEKHSNGKEKFCFMEKVSGFTGFHFKSVQCPHCGKFHNIKEGDPGSRMFNFGDGYGFLRSTMMTLKIPLELLAPQRWQKAFYLGKKGDCKSTTEWKNKLKNRAQQYFPQLKKITLAVSDALIILKYGILYGKPMEELPF